MSFFKELDLNEFWEDSDYARSDYIEDYPSDELIKSVELELGYKLPASYISLMRNQNGGLPNNTCFPTKEGTSWADDHVGVTGILGIGSSKNYSLCGELGSQFMMDEWGYPNDGVYVGDCPSAGHDMILLDYSKCGKEGEPTVVHVDQESDYKKTFLANNFEEFVLGLVNESVYNPQEEIDDEFQIYLQSLSNLDSKNEKHLLDNHNRLLEKNQYGTPYIELIVNVGDIHFWRELMDRGVILENIIGNCGFNMNLDRIKMFIELGADVYKKGENTMHVLHCAISAEKVETVKFLVNTYNWNVDHSNFMWKIVKSQISDEAKVSMNESLVKLGLI